MYFKKSVKVRKPGIGLRVHSALGAHLTSYAHNYPYIK